MIQRQVNAEEYGPTVSDLEKQIAAHNILHKEIEAYGSQINASSANSQVQIVSHGRNSNIHHIRYPGFVSLFMWLVLVGQNVCLTFASCFQNAQHSTV